jgi:uncharacterized protein (TIGR02452 family)
MQPKIFEYLPNQDARGATQRHWAKRPWHGLTDDEKAARQATQARYKEVGEDTRQCYAQCEEKYLRVKESYHKTYMTSKCPRILQQPNEKASPMQIQICPQDSFDAAGTIRRRGIQSPIGVLNMANAETIGGGFLKGSTAQEEALCRRSTLYKCLCEVKNVYPHPPTGLVISPDVLVFRGGPEVDLLLLLSTDQH